MQTIFVMVKCELGEAYDVADAAVQTIEQVSEVYSTSGQYDLLLIPGGAWNPIMLSTDGDALRLVRQAREQGLLLASLCHGPQVIAHAAFDAPEGETNFPAQGVHITAASDVRLLLQLAGFVVHGDRTTVFDPSVNLLTSRDPNDLQAFCQEIGRLSSARLAAL